jgi:hypothetical protein
MKTLVITLILAACNCPTLAAKRAKTPSDISNPRIQHQLCGMALAYEARRRALAVDGAAYRFLREEWFRIYFVDQLAQRLGRQQKAHGFWIWQILGNAEIWREEGASLPAVVEQVSRFISDSGVAFVALRRDSPVALGLLDDPQRFVSSSAVPPLAARPWLQQSQEYVWHLTTIKSALMRPLPPELESLLQSAPPSSYCWYRALSHLFEARGKTSLTEDLFNHLWQKHEAMESSFLRGSDIADVLTSLRDSEPALATLLPFQEAVIIEGIRNVTDNWRDDRDEFHCRERFQRELVKQIDRGIGEAAIEEIGKSLPQQRGSYATHRPVPREQVLSRLRRYWRTASEVASTLELLHEGNVFIAIGPEVARLQRLVQGEDVPRWEVADFVLYNPNEKTFISVETKQGGVDVPKRLKKGLDQLAVTTREIVPLFNPDGSAKWELELDIDEHFLESMDSRYLVESIPRKKGRYLLYRTLTAFQPVRVDGMLVRVRVLTLEQMENAQALIHRNFVE